MQFLRNQLPDFKSSWSCLILTVLLIEQCTMYPPHLNCATTVPCKTLTMKITIFIIMLVLKSEENIACYQFKTLWKQFISNVQMPAPAFTQARSFLTLFSIHYRLYVVGAYNVISGLSSVNLLALSLSRCSHYSWAQLISACGVDAVCAGEIKQKRNNFRFSFVSHVWTALYRSTREKKQIASRVSLRRRFIPDYIREYKSLRCSEKTLRKLILFGNAAVHKTTKVSKYGDKMSRNILSVTQKKLIIAGDRRKHQLPTLRNTSPEAACKVSGERKSKPLQAQL